MEFPDIRLLLPHAGSMVLLDRVITANSESLIAEVIIRPDNIFYQESSLFSGVGTWVGIELMAQAVAAYAGYMAYLKHEAVKIGFLIGSRQYVCHKSFFAVNSRLRVSTHCILQADNGLGSFQCQITMDNQEIANAIINAFLPDNIDNFLEGKSNA